MKSFENQPNYNCRIVLDDGQSFLVNSHWLHNEGLDYYKGWNCQAGSLRLYVDKNLQVYSGLCQNDYLGPALSEFDLLDGTVCQRPRCSGCTDDTITTKDSMPNARK